MGIAIFDDRGIRFEYPEGWELEVQEDGARTTVSVQAPSGLAFALVALDGRGESNIPSSICGEGRD